MTASNIEEFNVIVAHIFARLYNSFPMPTGLGHRELAGKMGVGEEEYEAASGNTQTRFGNLPTGRSFNLCVYMSADWLVNEGLIRESGPKSSGQYVLTKEALIVMNKVPQGISSGGTIGHQITEVAKDAGKSAAGGVMSDLVGQIIGGVAKGFMS